jgi:hypothetical protein
VIKYRARYDLPLSPGDRARLEKLHRKGLLQSEGLVYAHAKVLALEEAAEAIRAAMDSGFAPSEHPKTLAEDPSAARAFQQQVFGMGVGGQLGAPFVVPHGGGANGHQRLNGWGGDVQRERPVVEPMQGREAGFEPWGVASVTPPAPVVMPQTTLTAMSGSAPMMAVAGAGGQSVAVRSESSGAPCVISTCTQFYVNHY